MPRFAVGSRVRMIGGVAEYYCNVTALVIDVLPNTSGLPHLTRYRVSLSNHLEDTFYEFQLTSAEDAASGKSHKASA